MRTLLSVFFLSFAIPSFAQLERDIDRIRVNSSSIRGYNWSTSGASSSWFFYYHTFKKTSMDGERWVGVYGGRMRPYVVDNPESKKFMNRFLGLSIGRQACLAISLPIISYIAYDNWVNDTPLNEHIGLALIMAVPVTAYILIPHAKKNTLSRAARAYNDGL